MEQCIVCLSGFLDTCPEFIHFVVKQRCPSCEIKRILSTERYGRPAATSRAKLAEFLHYSMNDLCTDCPSYTRCLTANLVE